MDRAKSLERLQRELERCAACPEMIGPVVHGPPVLSSIYLLGQAPGVHEGELGRPFAWTAGKRLFAWFAQLGVGEREFRERVYMSAVARCFPGKAPKGGDRKPSPEEIVRCRPFIERELDILKPRLVLPVGTMAIEQVFGEKRALSEVVGQVAHLDYHGIACDVIALPHPSGASTWHRMEPGRTLLELALKRLGEHRAWRELFPEAKGKGRS